MLGGGGQPPCWGAAVGLSRYQEEGREEKRVAFRRDAEGEGRKGAEEAADVAGVGGADAGVVVDLGAAARECNLFGRGPTLCSKRRCRWHAGEGTGVICWGLDGE